MLRGRREPPFIGGEEGALGNVRDHHMQVGNHLLGTFNPPNTCGMDVATAVSVNRLNSKPNGAGGGVS
jgi:hypothetical protein